MKKKFILALLCLLTYSIGVSAADGDTVQVKTCQELKAAIKKNKCIQLRADINMKDYGDPVERFTGTIDGREEKDASTVIYTLSNMKECLAEEMSGATIIGINFKDCTPCWHFWSGSDEGMGLLCHKSDHCEFITLSLDNVKLDFEKNSFTLINYVARHSYGGLLVGIDYQSTFSGIMTSNSYVYVSNNKAGGIVGSASGSTFRNIHIGESCGTYAHGYGEFNATKVGGVAGEAESCSFTSCVNKGLVASPMDRVGGIAGWASNGSTFEKCSNYGSVMQTSIGSISSLASSASQSETTSVLNGWGTFLVSGAQMLNINGGTKDVVFYVLKTSTSIAKLTALKNRRVAYESLIEGHMHDLEHLITSDDGTEMWKSMIKQKKHLIDVSKLNIADIDKEIKTLEAENPVKEGAKVENAGDVNGSSLSRMLGYLKWFMYAIQVAQIIYESQDNDNVGGIVGFMEDGGKLTACANYGVVYCHDAYSGGIAGETEDVDIDCCYNGGVVSGDEQTGGIVGYMDGGTIRGCLNTGNVADINGDGDGDNLGRIYGEKDDATSYGNCVVSNTIEPENQDRRGVTLRMLASGEVAKYLNKRSGKTYWRQTLGVDMYPILDELSDSVTTTNMNALPDTIYHVSDVVQLMNAGTNQYAHIVLDADIDVGSVFNLSSRFMPFHGVLDGNGHTLRNATYMVRSREASSFSGSRDNNDNALFSAASNATFKNVTLENFNIFFPSEVAAASEMNSLLVARSKNCRYENVHVTGISGIKNIEYGWAGKGIRGHKNAGLVAHSEGDTFVDCSIGDGTEINGESGIADFNSEVGGLTCLSYNSSFTRCYNAGSVKGKNGDYVGGLSCKDEGSTFNSCLNMGYIQGDEYIGGLVGKAIKSKFINCVNTGTIDGGSDNYSTGGLAGYFNCGSKVSKDNFNGCLNFGSITSLIGSSPKNGGFFGLVSEEYSVGNNLYDIQYRGTNYKNVSDQQLADLKSGAYAYTQNADSVIWYQSLDNHKTFCSWPVPIPEAGSVLKNYLCDDATTLMYSNRYHATQGHSHDLSSLGICKTCGYLVSAPSADATIDICDAQDLEDFSTIVSSSTTYNKISARLMNDIDITGYVFDAIGSHDVPYCGTFNGRGHRIKNMSLTAIDTKSCGFFNDLGNGAVIDSLIIDASCTINGSGLGMAGIAGCVTSTSGSTCNVTISNCGNEAAVTGSQNVAGILGGVYNNDKSVITITNCYNIGNINGSKESAVICGYARNNYTITNCYNAGSLSGGSGENLFYRNFNSGTHKVENCYDVNGKQGQGVKALTLAEITSGELCYKLNGSTNTDIPANGFYQQLNNTVTYPSHDVNANNLVKAATKNYCDASTATAYYNPFRYNTDYTKTFHHYDENGFCTAVKGETHYEEPDTIHSGNNIIYQLRNAGNLYWVADQVNNGWSHPNCVLMNDIVVNTQSQNSTSDLRKWTPIGTEKYPYINATFNGNGHTISGLYCKDDTLNGVGLFGFAYNGAVIRNVGVVDCYFSGLNGVGGIVGWGGESFSNKDTWTVGNGPSLFQCFSTGNVHGEDYAGGLAGFINDGTLAETNAKISTCYSTAIVYSLNYAGPLFGYMGDKVSISENLNNCYWNHSIFSNLIEGYGTKMSGRDFTLGKVCNLLCNNEEEDSIRWSQDITTQNTPVFGHGGVRMSRTVDQKWGTVLLPYAVYSDSLVSYCEIDTIIRQGTSDIATLRLKQVDMVPANTPCFFYNNTDSTVVVFNSDCREVAILYDQTESVTKTFEGKDAEIIFTGAFKSQTATDDQFVLTCDSAMWNVSQIMATGGVTVEPFHAYFSQLNGTDLSGLKQLNITIKGEDFDFNDDGVFNSKDIVLVNNLLTGITTSDNCYDTNKDGKFSMGDITTMSDRLVNRKVIVLTPPSSTGTITGK